MGETPMAPHPLQVFFDEGVVEAGFALKPCGQAFFKKGNVAYFLGFQEVCAFMRNLPQALTGL